MDLIILLAQVYLGLLFFFFIKSARYVVKGTFDFSKWRKENLAKVIYAYVGATLLGLIYFIDPASITFVLKYVGYEMEGGMQLTGVMIGLIFGFAVREIMKREAKYTPPSV